MRRLEINGVDVIGVPEALSLRLMPSDAGVCSPCVLRHRSNCDSNPATYCGKTGSASSVIWWPLTKFVAARLSAGEETCADS